MAMPGAKPHPPYFHGDNGAGLGAAHQTGWTALVVDLILAPRQQHPEQHRGRQRRGHNRLVQGHLDRHQPSIRC
jgi:hypothetical protein